MPVVITRSLNVATPPTASSVTVPCKLAPPGLVASAIVTGSELVASGWPLVSSTCT